MKTIANFFLDFLNSFIYFVYKGIFYPLFFRFPKVYEALVSFIIVAKNTLPDKFELSYTINHWRYIVLKGMLDSILFTLKQLTDYARYLNIVLEGTLTKIERLIYVSNRNK